MNTILDQKKIDLISKYFCRGGASSKNAKKIGYLSISQSSITKKNSEKTLNRNSSNGLGGKTSTSYSTKKQSVVNSVGKITKDSFIPFNKRKGKY